MVVVVLSMSSHDHRLLCEPEIVTRGFVYVKESEELLQELRELAMSTVDGMAARRRKDDNEVCRAVRSAVSSYLYKHTQAQPHDHPHGHKAVRGEYRKTAGRYGQRFFNVSGGPG